MEHTIELSLILGLVAAVIGWLRLRAVRVPARR